jgi:transcriptional regulator with XRE-family HTH domain
VEQADQKAGDNPLGPSTLGMYVRARREERNLTTTQLAELVGCSHSYISQLETKQPYLLNKKFIRPLARALDVPVDVILLLDGIRDVEQGRAREDQLEAIALILGMSREKLRLVRPVLRSVAADDERDQ